MAACIQSMYVQNAKYATNELSIIRGKCMIGMAFSTRFFVAMILHKIFVRTSNVTQFFMPLFHDHLRRKKKGKSLPILENERSGKIEENSPNFLLLFSESLSRQ